ncbi:hypothetical protein M885DRAFT_569246 [Pelagophyceae sp. CCMP2097]|nr:hypothetical protein M885DRAFT_569246 [Pelagophyceae sp. CCMP2097]
MPTVQSFMVPSAKCVCAFQTDSLKSVVEAIVSQRIGCVVLLDGEKAVGIVTKGDVARLYLESVPLSTPIKEIALPYPLVSASPESTRGEAAKLLEHHKIHHALASRHEERLTVVDSAGAFRGLYSSWDIVREAAVDAEAWPYTTQAKMHRPASSGALDLRWRCITD